MSEKRAASVEMERHWADFTKARSQVFYKKANHGSFCLFLFLSNTILQKNCRFSWIQTRIVWVEGEHADHLTTTTAQFVGFWGIKKPHVVSYFFNLKSLPWLAEKCSHNRQIIELKWSVLMSAQTPPYVYNPLLATCTNPCCKNSYNSYAMTCCRRPSINSDC